MRVIYNLFLALTVMFMASCEGCTPSFDMENPPWENCANLVGEHVCDFTFKDQNGDDFRLYENYGKVIVLDFSTMWCGYCQVLALETQDMQDKYGPEGFVYITVLFENMQGKPPTKGDLQMWAQAFGITTAPILAGDRILIDYGGPTSWDLTGWPTVYMLDRDLVLRETLRGYGKGRVEEATVSLLSENLDDAGAP